MQAQALAGLKVVELADWISGPYCGKLLADMGAEVIKVEPPIGDQTRRHGPFLHDEPHPEKSGLFLYLNTNKLGITLDIATTTGRDLFKKLISEVDIILESFPPGWLDDRGLGFGELGVINPQLILTSLTPFGQTGPYKHFRTTDLVATHAGGLGYNIPGQVEDPDLPPLRAAGRQAEYTAGMVGAVATLQAVFAREQDGQGAHVDLSLQEAVLSMAALNITAYAYQGKARSRLKGGEGAESNILTLPCKDGFFCFVVMEERMWRDWVDVMGDAKLAQDERFKNRAARIENWDALQSIVTEWAMQRTKAEIYRLGQAKRIPVSPVNTMDEVAQSRHLQERGYFVEVLHPVAGSVTIPGAPYRLAESPWQVRRPAPALGQHNAEIFGERLGFPKESLTKLRASGII